MRKLENSKNVGKLQKISIWKITKSFQILHFQKKQTVKISQFGTLLKFNKFPIL